MLPLCGSTPTRRASRAPVRCCRWWFRSRFKSSVTDQPEKVRAPSFEHPIIFCRTASARGAMGILILLTLFCVFSCTTLYLPVFALDCRQRRWPPASCRKVSYPAIWPSNGRLDQQRQPCGPSGAAVDGDGRPTAGREAAAARQRDLIFAHGQYHQRRISARPCSVSSYTAASGAARPWSGLERQLNSGRRARRARWRLRLPRLSAAAARAAQRQQGPSVPASMHPPSFSPAPKRGQGCVKIRTQRRAQDGDHQAATPVGAKRPEAAGPEHFLTPPQHGDKPKSAIVPVRYAALDAPTRRRATRSPPGVRCRDCGGGGQQQNLQRGCVLSAYHTRSDGRAPSSAGRIGAPHAVSAWSTDSAPRGGGGGRSARPR